MTNIYLSFLGLGQFKEDSKAYEYTPTVYKLNERESAKTQFVQAAEIELLASDCFDKVIIVSTQRSYDTHFETLKQGLMDVGVIENKIFNVQIGDAMTPKSQWEGFEKILYHINKGDRLTIDLTHGYRASSIILSAAINFLQKAKGIQLMAVYYGAFEANRQLAPIVDMKDFYIINFLCRHIQ